MIISLIEENVKETFSVRKMLHFNNTRFTTYSVMYCLLLHTLQASSDSCHISKSTVQIVDNCPKSEKKWKQAAVKKNCEALASQCSEPERLEYHCVINPFINQTIEVCAYAQNIVLGYCTEYSTVENMIQQSAKTHCRSFQKNPCPIFYRSTEAYKYQDCYELTKRTAIVTEDRESTIKLFTVIYKASSLSTEREFSRIEGRVTIILLVLSIALTLTLVGCHIFGHYYRVKKHNRPTTYEKERDVAINLMEQN